MFDPRPDLAHDSSIWEDLLYEAFWDTGSDPNGLFGALSGLRCLGAGASVDAEGRPRYTLGPGEINPKEYEAYRNASLMRHRPALTQLLQKVYAQREKVNARTR